MLFIAISLESGDTVISPLVQLAEFNLKIKSQLKKFPPLSHCLLDFQIQPLQCFNHLDCFALSHQQIVENF
jgi:hypothetical protein